MGNDPSGMSVNIMRFLVGFLLALALFLIELGMSQIKLTDDARCREIVQSARLGSDPDEECLSEGIRYFLIALSRGPFASAHSTIQPVMAWIFTGLIYSTLGGTMAALLGRFAVGIFLGIHALGLVIFTLVAYLSNYIV